MFTFASFLWDKENPLEAPGGERKIKIPWLSSVFSTCLTTTSVSACLISTLY